MALIVIDAGHGGDDGGSVGVVSGAKESDLNLVIARKLKGYLENIGFKVVLTRETSDGLYKLTSKDKKYDDMAKRKEIIEKTKPFLVVSIHQNSFPMASMSGAQTFYQQGNELGKTLADLVQNELIKNLGEHARGFANKGDYYILNSTSYPAILVECGYLSNPEEDRLLNDGDYQDKIAYSIMCGIFAVANKNLSA